MRKKETLPATLSNWYQRSLAWMYHQRFWNDAIGSVWNRRTLNSLAWQFSSCGTIRPKPTFWWHGRKGDQNPRPVHSSRTCLLSNIFPSDSHWRKRNQVSTLLPGSAVGMEGNTKAGIHKHRRSPKPSARDLSSWRRAHCPEERARRGKAISTYSDV